MLLVVVYARSLSNRRACDARMACSRTSSWGYTSYMVDPDRLSAAYETARCDLLAESTAAGQWCGRTSSSPLATAAALCALTVVERHAPTTVKGRLVDEHRDCRLSELIMASLLWLAKAQNADGGWSDSDGSDSSLAATMLVRAAFGLTCVPADRPGMLERADAYIKLHGGASGLKRQAGGDQSLPASILATCALAGLVSWRKVPALPLERMSLPERYWKWLRLPVCSRDLPALVAVGLARFVYRKPWNPLVRAWRQAKLPRALARLAAMQTKSGGFAQDVPLTSFVVMGLAASGQDRQPVVGKGIDFLLDAVLSDASWPLLVEPAARSTAQATLALASAGESLADLPGGLDGLLAAQQRQKCAVTGTEAGGWAASYRQGDVPNAVDTANVLLALAAWSKQDAAAREKIFRPAISGVRWLLDLQNDDGGWPTFSQDWPGPSDASGADVTALALRAIKAWHATVIQDPALSAEGRGERDQRISDTAQRGLEYLRSAQNLDGSWTPLWYGVPARPGSTNTICGTAQVLLALRDFGQLENVGAQRALDWLAAVQRPSGGWASLVGRGDESVEETSLATIALMGCGQALHHEAAAERGIAWLAGAVEANRHQRPAAIGLAPGRLCYYEWLVPLSLVAETLGRAARRVRSQRAAPAPVHSKT